MKLTSTLVFVVSAITLFGCPQREKYVRNGKPRVAVGRLIIPVSLVVPWWPARETNFLHNQILSALVKTGVLDVVERTRFDKIVGEQQLTRDQFTDPDEAAKLGKVLGADYFVLGTLADVKLSRDSHRLPYTSKNETILYGRIKIDFRIVEVETSLVAASRSEETVIDRRILSGTEDAAALNQELNDLAKRAAADIAREIVDALIPIKVVAVGEDEVELSRGASTGIRTGDQLDVFELGEALKDQETGRMVEQRRQRVAQIEVTAVRPGAATARVARRTGNIRVGALCDLLPPPSPPPAQGEPDPLNDRW